MEPLDADGCDQVDTALLTWRQGDCVAGEQWFVFRTDLVDVQAVVQTLEDLTAREYVESDPLGLDYLSTRDG